MFFPEPNERLSKQIFKFNRTDLSFIITAITGHNYLRHSSNKLTLLGTTKCRLCKDGTETFCHLTNECRELTTQQLEHLNNRKFEGKHTKWNPVDLSDFLNLEQKYTSFSPTSNTIPI